MKERHNRKMMTNEHVGDNRLLTASLKSEAAGLSHGEKGRGMRLLSKSTIVLALTLLISVFMYGGLFSATSAQAALQYVGGATGTGTGASYSVSLTGLTGGSGSTALAGDLVIVVTGWASGADGNPGVTTPTGYTEAFDIYASDTRDANLSVNWKIMGSTPDTSVTVSGFNNAANGGATAVHVWRGADKNTPMDVTPTSVSASNNAGVALPNSPAITPVTAGAYVLTVGLGTGAASPTAFTAPSGYANTVSAPGAGSTMGAIASIASIAWTSGAVDPAAWTGTTSTSDSWTAGTLAIRPATPPTLTSPTASSVATTTATLGATVSNDGGLTLSARGTVWNTTTVPTANPVAEGGTTASAYSHSRTGLPAQTKIYYRGYATNPLGTSYSPEGSFYTEPATQASAITFSGITSTGMTVNWTRGSGGAGGGVIVLMKATTAVDSDPVDGTYTSYTASAAYPGGFQLGTGNYVVYKGTGTSVAVTGLSPTTTYHVAVYEFSGQIDTSVDAQGTNYKLTPAVANQATPAAPFDTLTVTANTAVASSAAPLDTNVQMQRLQLDSNNGDNGNVVITSITVDDLGTAGATDITNLKVTLDADNIYNNANELGTVTQAGFNGSSTVVSLLALAVGDRTVSFGIPKYIWITYDLASSADTKTVQSSVTAIAVVASDAGATGTWNSSIISVSSGPGNTLADCASCHNYPPVDSLSRDGATGNFIGDHDKHATNTCATCHVTPATETSTDFAHRTGKLSMDNGNIGVGADNGTYSKGTEFNQINNPNGGTCSLVDCHNNVVSPQWGVGNTACDSCHALPPALNAHSAHYTAKGWAADNVHCVDCHPNNTTGHSDVTDNSVTVNAGLSPSGTSPAISCATTPTGCHNGKATPAWNTTNIACTACHTAGGAAAGDPTTGLHATTNLTDHDGTLTGGTGLACEKCHTAAPSVTHYNGTVDTPTVWNTTNIPAGYVSGTDSCAATCHTDSGTWNREWSGVTDAAWAYANDAATTAVCGNCHGSFFTGWNIVGNTTHDNPDIDNDPDTLATSKASHTECSTCHAWGHTNYTTGVKHENNTLEMNSTLDTTPGDGSCTTTCHAPLTLTMNATSGWTDASVVGAGVVCGGCHTGGVTTATASGAHTVHGATAASVAANPASIALCIECHGNDGTGATHNNGSVNFVNVTYSTAVRNDTSGTCLTANCHNVNTKALQSTLWSSSALDCNSCHFYPTTTPAVTVTTSAANSAAGRPLSTTHGAHFDGGKTCNQCHGTMPVAGDTAHITTRTSLADMAVAVVADNASVVWTDAAAATDYTFENTGNTCGSATNNGLGCHATGTPDWDVAFASTACINCHTGTINAFVDPTSGLHGATPSVTAEKHDDSFDGATANCSSCHTTIPVAGTHKDGNFDGGNGQTTAMGLAAFYTQTANDTGTCATTTCHLGGATGSDAWAHKWMTPANYTSSPAACTGCHGNLASGWNAGVDHLVGEIATDHADDGTASNYGCETCHVLQAATNNYPFTFGTADWAPLNAGNKHGNGLITMNDDGTGTITNWQRGTAGNLGKSACIKCHGWSDVTRHDFVATTWTPEEIVGDTVSAGHGVGAACISCHDGFTQGTRRNVGLEFDLTKQHGTATPTSADCEKCHDESSGPDTIIQLKVWDAAGTGFTPVTYSSTDLSSANTHCISCHDTTRNVTVGGLSPPARSMVNFTSATTYNNHNFTTATGAVVPQMAKAISPHGNPNGNQLKGAESTVTTAMGCLHCHPSHGSSVATKAATADATGVAMTAKMIGGKPSELASVGYDYTNEGTLSDPNLCWACHDAKGVADYYGDTTTGHWNGGTWKNPSFSYKTAKGGVTTLHIADKVDGGTADNAAANIVCTTCHDVHGSPTVAQFYSPALKGKWLTSPYYEDRAPPAKASGTAGLYSWADANSAARSAADALSPRAAIVSGTGWVPKEIGGGYGTVGTQNGAWGWFIDGNTFGMSAYQPYTTGAVTQKYFYTIDSTNFTSTGLTNFAGLCMTACHSAANIESRTTWTGHNPVVPGFGGTDADTDLINVNGTTYPSTTAKVRNQMVGQGWYNNTGWGQTLFAQDTPGERQGGDAGALDGKTYSHNKAFSYGVNPTATGVQNGFHQFPCSKCHTPHATELPALMRTNCLNTAKSGYEWRMSAEANNCHRVEDSGAPIIGPGDPYPGTGYPTTHGGVTNGGWNAVTPW